MKHLSVLGMLPTGSMPNTHTYKRAYVEQEKRVKYTGIIANCVMLDNTVEISNALNALAREGIVPTIDELAALSPYQTRHIKRFGNYELDLSAIPAPVTIAL